MKDIKVLSLLGISLLLCLTSCGETGIKINPEKEHFYCPGEAWEFLGVSCNNKEVDLSSGTIRKIKGKIR